MSTHKCITNPNMRLPKRKSPKKNNMSQLFFSKTGFDNCSEAILRSMLHTVCYLETSMSETMSIGNV